MTTPAAQTTPSGDETCAEEFRGLTGLRIVAAVWVVAFHFHFTALSGVARVDRALGPLVTQGALGVDLFFVLSGFVIAHTYLDRLGPRLRIGATRRFLWARIARMWPAYLLVFNLFGVWLAARLVFGHDRVIAFQAVQPVVGVGRWLGQVLLVQLWDSAYLDGTSWVGPTWSLSAEWLAYLAFPVAALGFWRLRLLPAPVLAAASLLVMTPLAVPYLVMGSPYYPFSWLARIGCGFSAGVLMCLAVRRARRTDALRRMASGLVVGLPLLIAAGLWVGGWVGPGRGGVVIVGFPLLVGAIALADRGPALLLSRPLMVQGGRVSYCLYLVHIPLFEVYWLVLQHGWLDRVGSYLAGEVVLVVAFELAALTHRFVEEPARRWLGSRGPGRPPVDLDELAAARAVRALPRPRQASGAERLTPSSVVHGDDRRGGRPGRLASPEHG